MKICIYGGSFNPPHLGHTAALRAVRAAIEPDVTLVIPDRIPPHKELTPGSPEPSERLLMTMLAFSSEPGVEVSDMELHRSGKSYTVDTVRELRDCNPDAELYLVVGTDMLTTFEQWHDYRALLAQVTLVALARTSDEHAEVERFSAYLRQTYGARVIALPAEPIPVTSTDVRRLLPQRRGSEYLAPDVYAHIIQQRLYGARPDLNWLREQAYPMLKPRRISHVWGCEHEARRLAERWGCDPDAAAEAGILHDCTKKFELSDQLLLSDKYGIINDTVETANTTMEELSAMMVGRSVSFHVDKKPAEPGEVVLEVEGMTMASKLHKNNAVKNVSLKVRRGEIVCLAGIDGNGQTEFVYGLTGLEPLVSGSVKLCGKDITHASIRQRSVMGMSHIPEDRHKHGLVLDYSLEDNMVLQRYFEPEFTDKAGFLRRRNIRTYAEKLIDQYDVRSGQGPITIARSMSGGNQQKAIVAREIDKDPELLVAVQPTRGLDVGAIEYIHRQLVAQRDEGKAVLLVSLELDEVMDVPDRILVMYEGEIVGELDPKKTTQEELGLYMAGAKRDEVKA